MNVADVVGERGIERVLHFTTNRGLCGVLADGQLLSRQRLPESKYLKHVYRPNASVRKDVAWLDYVNLSISRLNWEFFEHSQRWHADRDVWWCALVLDPAVLSLDGVTFATTNNIYSGCERGTGAEGLEAMFAPRVCRWAGNCVERFDGMPRSWTTCHQAEALVPESVSVEHLRRICVATHAHADIAASQCDILLNASMPSLPIDIDPHAFAPPAR